MTVTESEIPIWDAHVHNWGAFTDPEAFRIHLERYPIRKVNLLGPLIGGWTPTPLEVEASNERTRLFRDAFPDRVEAYCYVNPVDPAHAVREWKRCRALGFTGLKLWAAVRCDRPEVEPVVREAIAAGAPILIHVWTKADGSLPGESLPDDFAALAARFPEGRFIMAHIGGRYEHGLAAIDGLPNVWLDYAGSANEAGAYEAALATVGPERILFGTDGPCHFLSCRARVLEAIDDPAIRRRIFFDNMAALAAGNI